MFNCVQQAFHCASWKTDDTSYLPNLKHLWPKKHRTSPKTPRTLHKICVSMSSGKNKLTKFLYKSERYRKIPRLRPPFDAQKFTSKIGGSLIYEDLTFDIIDQWSGQILRVKRKNKEIKYRVPTFRQWQNLRVFPGFIKDLNQNLRIFFKDSLHLHLGQCS